ncbi:MAG TPA: tetratricopeptide repeat protein [Myxococcota bacterium]|nr:tetratricopeptide repeat protein [Myxococcota bacterium]HRY93308.1 tetratricopeptide repeat protein [Myxococcota bacterium]HSA19893.1 tetratricopeptide repeat protein [Myxococcota bacterium]
MRTKCTWKRWAPGLGMLLGLLGLWTPATARAGSPAELGQGIEAYENFEYAEALELLQAASRQPDLSRPDQVRILLYLGLVQFTMGERGLAEQAFEAALRMDRKLQLPADTSPKIAEAFEAVRARLPLEPKAKPEVGPKPGPTGPDDKPRPGPVAAAPAPEPAGRVWTWVLAGLGGAALAAGGTCGYLASASQQEFKDATWAADAMEAKAEAEDRALAANVLYGLGGAALVTALVLFFVELDDPPADGEGAPAPGLVPAPGGAALRW